MKIIHKHSHHYLLHAMFDWKYLFQKGNLMEMESFLLPLVNVFDVDFNLCADDGGRGISTGRF
jgi:hypothetical protein